MNELLSSQEFVERHRLAVRRDRTTTLAAIVPAGLYLLQRTLREGRPLPGLTPRIDEIVFWVLAGWFLLLLFGVGRSNWKNAGLVCSKCKTEFRSTAFDAVSRRGRCPTCNAQILSDVSASVVSSVEDLVFQYPRYRAIVLLLSIPVVGALGLAMIIGFAGILLESNLTPKRVLAGLALISIGLAFVALVVILAPTWRSLLTRYVVNTSGVTSLYRGSSSFHQWSDLEEARYGRLTGLLVLRFRGNARPVVLSNSDEDPEATNLKLARHAVEQHGGTTIRSALL